MVVEPIEWRGIVAVQYGTVILADAEGAVRGLGDTQDFTLVWEERCGSLGEGVQVLLPERDDDVPTHIRVLAATHEPELEWEHVAEVGFRVPTGRLVVFSWMVDEDLAGELTVPTQPLVARIHWGGLERWLEWTSDRDRDEPSALSLRIDLIPGELDGVRTLRTWHLWEPPTQESTSPEGLRRFRGHAATKRRASLVASKLLFWMPYPTTAEGTVDSMWQDPIDGSRWASGNGPMSHPFLQELTPDEAAALEAQGFQQVRTYARDSNGRIWTSDLIPIERAPALMLIPPDRFAVLQGILSADEMRIIDLPDGWERITRRPLDRSGPAVLVPVVTGDGDDGFYHRWRDGAEILQ